MRKLMWLVAAVAAMGFAGCGSSDDSDGGVAGTLTSGTYTITSIDLTAANDGCALADAPQTKVGYGLGVTVSGQQIILFTESGTKPTGTINGSDFTASASSTGAIEGVDCTDTVKKTVDGIIVGNDEFSGTYVYEESNGQGTQCTANDLGYTLPCKTQFTFTAKKQQ